MGLLLVRLAVGIATVLRGTGYLFRSEPQAIGTWLIGGLATIAGACLGAGFLTPVMGALISLGAAVTALLSPESRLADGLVAVVSAAITLTGPGAFSIDARLFGLRKITIPSVPHDAR